MEDILVNHCNQAVVHACRAVDSLIATGRSPEQAKLWVLYWVEVAIETHNQNRSATNPPQSSKEE